MCRFILILLSLVLTLVSCEPSSLALASHGVLSLSYVMDVSLPVKGSITFISGSLSPLSTLSMSYEATNLSETAWSEDDLSYQWYKEGDILEGERGKSLTFTAPEAGSARYDILVSTQDGDVGSVSILIKVRP